MQDVVPGPEWRGDGPPPAATWWLGLFEAGPLCVCVCARLCTYGGGRTRLGVAGGQLTKGPTGQQESLTLTCDREEDLCHLSWRFLQKAGPGRPSLCHARSPMAPLCPPPPVACSLWQSFLYLLLLLSSWREDPCLVWLVPRHPAQRRHVRPPPVRGRRGCLWWGEQDQGQGGGLGQRTPPHPG